MSGTENKNTDDTNFVDTSTDQGRELLRQENRDAVSDINDNTGERETARRSEQQERSEQERKDPETGQPVRMTPGDNARDAIAKRFRRAGESVPFNGDPNDPEMLYGDVARVADTPEDGVDETIISGERRTEPQKTQQQEPPKKRKLLVRGQEIELTEEEILARASMVTAADSYLEEARETLREAKSIKAERAGQRSQHPEDQSGTQDDGLDNDNGEDRSQHPESRTKSVVEKIQFGDPEEAAAELDRLIDERADKKTDERQLKRLMDNDLSKSQKALKDFVAANPELNGDKMAARAIEQTLYDIYEEDIVKLGKVDADKIPKDPQAKAQWHRFYRVHGEPVRTAAEALEEAKTRVLRWRGVSTTQQQQSRKAPDRVDVNVNRTERRAAIPNSPTRSVAPRPDAAVTPAVTSRSDVISKMRKARGQVTA